MNSFTDVDLSQVHKIEHPTLSHRVYEDLRELLLAGQVQPGQRLTLKSLAEALGTSHMPVREAIRQLAAEGALELLPNKGIRVPLMTQDRFRELLKIRLALEGLAVEQAAQCMTPEEWESISRIQAALTEEMRHTEPDASRVIQLNKQLHFAIYRASRMPVLVGMIENIWLQVGPVINLDMRSGSRRLSEAPIVHHHDQLVDALRRGSAEESRVALAGDLLSAASVILNSGKLPENQDS